MKKRRKWFRLGYFESQRQINQRQIRLNQTSGVRQGRKYEPKNVGRGEQDDAGILIRIETENKIITEKPRREHKVQRKEKWTDMFPYCCLTYPTIWPTGASIAIL